MEQTAQVDLISYSLRNLGIWLNKCLHRAIYEVKADLQRRTAAAPLCRRPRVGFNGYHIHYPGMMTTSSFGIASNVALSMRRCAMTSSGGVWASHSDSERS